MDATYKKNKYNMPLLEVVRMTPTGKNFTVATVFMCNEHATTYKWFIQNWKNVVGGGNCGFRVVTNFLLGDENQWLEVRRRMSYYLQHHINMYVSLFGSVERVYELIKKTWFMVCYWLSSTDARWMPVASIAGPMTISSRYVSQWMGRTLL
ncbi:hypothetical protein M9H77_22929 [Catharanthus roseus]|uniref:Uncharacterized protein n=1 Tax=Catharanthus roseus TaxID=4058 RepID=A0ACC0ASJ9_CATRO|nr:hypothetical protein M9H77_22929 [Catharanthus roseus]